MSGDYLFPKRRFKEGEPLDKNEINEALQVSAERLNGHLNPHNIRAPLSREITSVTGTFFNTKVVSTDVDPGMQNANSSTAGQSPQPSAEGAFLLEQQTSWLPVTGGDEDMIVEMQTGSSSLIITAQAAHCYSGEYDGLGFRYRVTLPIFDFPPATMRSSGGRNTDVLVGVVIVLDPGGGATAHNVTFANVPVSDRRNFSDDGTLQSRELARKIAAGCQGGTPVPSSGSDALKVQEDGWPSIGYSVRAVGRDLIFSRLDPGVVSGSPTFSIGFVYTNNVNLTYNRTFNMEKVRDGSSSSTSGAFSDLSCAVAQDGTPSATPTVLKYFPAQIQYALRVDGVVITETITGRFDNEESPFSPSRILQPRAADKPTSTTHNQTGPMIGRFFEKPDSVNIPMYSVRLTASVEVAPGDHVVELVVRRIPMGRRRSFTPPPPTVGNATENKLYLSDDNKVFIYSRQLSVTDIPSEPLFTAAFGDPTVIPAFSNDDVVSNKSLVLEKLEPVKDAINDIDSFQVARGAINGDHLEGYSSVVDTATGIASDITLTSTSNGYEYPQGTRTTFAYQRFLYPASATPGWAKIVEATFDSPISVPLECVLTVEGNVFIRRLVNINLEQQQMHLSAACFIVALKAANSGNYFFWRPSLAWVNSNNYIAYQDSKSSLNLHGTPRSTVGFNYLSRYGEAPGANTVTAGDIPGDFVDVPVTAHIDFSGRPEGTPDSAALSHALLLSISSVAIYGAAAWMGNAGNSTAVRVKSATVNAVVTKS